MNLPSVLTDDLLHSAGAIALVYRRNGQSQLVELDGRPTPRQALTVDMRDTGYPTLILGALDTLANGGSRVLRIVGSADGGTGTAEIEVLMDERPLFVDLLRFSWSVLLVSLSLAILSAFVEARRISLPQSRTSVPAVQGTGELHEAVSVDHFA